MAQLEKKPIEFSIVAQLCRALEETTKRNEKIRLIREVLRKARPDDVSYVTLFLAGKPFPEADPRVLEISYATLSTAGKTMSQTLLTESANPLTMAEVFRTLGRLAEVKGAGSKEKRLALLGSLLARTTPLETEYLTRMLLGEMRIGVVEGVLLDAIAEASGVSRHLVRRAHMLHGDIGDVARLAMTDGGAALEKVGLRLFVPVKPMLAEVAEDIRQVLAEHKDGTAFEYKFDGARIQIHRQQDRIRIFSRRLTDVTDSIPEMVDYAKTKVKASEFLIEGEVVALGEGGKPVPFQDLMRRFRRVHGIEEMVDKIPLRLYLFDVLQSEGRTLIDLPYTERWETLSSLVPAESLAPRIVTRDLRVVDNFTQSALKAGHEGLMAKSLTSDYSPGARGKKWFKIKLADRLDVVIVAADWGSGRRVDWLSNYHLAVRDEDTGEYLVVGKTFKGLTDAEFDMITKRLQELKTRETKWTVHVKPEIVVEVAHNEVQKSPRYKSGFALRFARIAKFRDDKTPEEADTIQRLRKLYEKQFENKGRMLEEVA
ncbi:MAG TPA: ATP-dependent DNA ligase [Candidatus Bathyarchaeia archaeon]|nr:ATP-dependent DNA ligase [Candidatus Bathyarchaeia archaeon]